MARVLGTAMHMHYQKVKLVSKRILMKFLIAIAFSFSIFLLSFPVYAEEIRSFYSEIFISRDGSVSVQEDIEYDFEGELKHGILREIPYKYQIGIKNYNLRMNVAKVTDFNDAPYKYKVSRENGRVRVRIGDPDKEITRVHGYRIEYVVDGAIIFFKDHDELYWNVTGNEWKVPIDKASAKVYFDGGTPQDVRATCYTGVYGYKGSDCASNMTPNAVEFNASTGFRAGEGLTIVVGLPKGIIKEPSFLKKASWFISDNWFFSLPFLTLFVISYIWYTRGRDPEERGVIAVRYEPPKDLTPAEAGTLIDERADIIDITSTVIDLAVRGHLKIQEVESKKFIFFSDRDYKLIKLKEPAGGEFKDHERKVFSGVFEGGRTDVMVSELRNKFYSYLPGIKEALYGELVKGGYFSTSPEDTRKIFKWIGIGIIVAAFFLIPHWGMKLSVIASGLFILVFSRFMPRKTKKGSLAHEEILGFREFINRAERDRIERLAKDDPTLFDRVLPYALVFGLGDRWAEAFHDMYRNPPSWYDSPRYGNVFSSQVFVTDIGRSLHVMNNTFVSTPSRSGGYSGGSGFGGGSGGGFGGGGGGSW
ncbi:MAG: DUF2207 domain-containing protein [Ignavibacteriales bacterium]